MSDNTRFAGDYRTRVKIVRLVQPSSAGLIGAPEPTEELVAELYVKVVPSRSREYEAARTVYNEAELLLETRYRGGFNEAMIARIGERRLNISGIWDPDGLNQRLFIACKETK